MNQKRTLNQKALWQKLKAKPKIFFRGSFVLEFVLGSQLELTSQTLGKTELSRLFILNSAKNLKDVFFQQENRSSRVS